MVGNNKVNPKACDDVKFGVIVRRHLLAIAKEVYKRYGSVVMLVVLKGEEIQETDKKTG